MHAYLWNSYHAAFKEKDPLPIQGPAPAPAPAQRRAPSNIFFYIVPCCVEGPEGKYRHAVRKTSRKYSPQPRSRAVARSNVIGRLQLAIFHISTPLFWQVFSVSQQIS